MYAALFRSVLLPLYETHLRGRETLSALAELEQSQWRRPEEIAEISFRRMLDALEHAERNVPFYRRRFAEYGVSARKVKAPEDLASFPILTKDDVRKHRRELLAETHVGPLHESSTGGSTGEPMRFSLDHRTYERRVAAAIRSDRWAGAELGEKELHVWGLPLAENRWSAAVIKRDAHAALMRRKFVSTFHLRADRLGDTVREIAAFEARVVVGYTMPLYLLARAALQQGIAIPPPRGVVTAAEKLHEHQREVIERAFGAPVFERYGCREVMLIGAECEQHEGLHMNAEGVFVELYRGDKPAPMGTPGEVLLSDLHNRAMPLLRFRNEDVAIAKPGVCSCGRGLPLLGSVEGRSLDLIVGEGDRIVAGEVFPYMFKDLPVEQYQARQRADRSVIVRVVPGPGFEPETAKLVETRLRGVLGEAAPLSVEIVREIPLTPSGKFRVAVSEVPVDLGAVTWSARGEGRRSSSRGAAKRERARVAHVVLGLRAGGLERVVIDLATKIDRTRFDPLVIALEEPGELAPLLEPWGVPIRLARRGLDPASLLVLADRIAREGVDLVHTHNPSPHVHGVVAALLAAARRGRRRPRVVHTKHGRNYVDDARRVLVNRAAAALSDRIVAVSDDARRVALEVERVSAERLVTIRNGIDVDAFQPGDAERARRLAHVPDGALHVGCVARLSAEKDHATLIEAFFRLRALFPDARLSLVGEGPERGALEALCERLGVRSSTRFLGHRDDVAALLPGFDVFALASRTEGTSLTLLEAAAAGVPIVATRVGGNPEVVSDGETGLLVPAGDPDALAEAIVGLATCPERRRMGERGRASVEARYGVAKMVAAYESLYAEVLRLA